MKVRLFLCFFALLVIWTSAAGGAFAEAADELGLIRLHVVANSDDPGDQAVKLAVRDAIRGQVKGVVDCALSPDGAFFALEDAADDLERIANDTLCVNGYRYGARVSLGSFVFPEAEYAGYAVPAGKYRAVRIVLGAGAGRNWWCVLYPDLCFVDEACRARAASNESVVFYSSVGRWIDKTFGQGMQP